MNQISIVLPYGGDIPPYTPPKMGTIDHLPMEAHAKWHELQRLAENEKAINWALTEERRNAFAAREQEERNLYFLRNADKAPAEDSQTIKEVQHRLAHFDAEIARIDAALVRPTTHLPSLFAKLEKWVRGQVAKGNSFQVAPPVSSPLKKGEIQADAVERIRQRIRHLREDLKTVKAAPIPSEMAKRLAREQIEARAKAARPDVLELVETGGKVKWPTSANLHMIRLRDDAASVVVPQVDVVGLLAWISGDALIAGIEREIDDMADDQNALTPQEQKTRKAEILADILAFEREEEAIIETTGTAIVRRLDADPRAILGVAIVEENDVEADL
ncbi:hypothetical protein [Microvirga flavescens]|uniref:hypothetical protein n=1 Tax=Microvirga flavescens TaxID=2249811 RepID=UPI001300ACBE|nr:hypothetical protein [Microvirga flavescens]